MKNFLFLMVFLVFIVPGFAIQEVMITEADITNVEAKLDENEIIFKMLKGFDMDQYDHLYFLDGNYAKLFKVHFPSYKLVKTMMAKGQGPSELSQPGAMRIRGGKIFIYDFGASAIKIFDLEGEPIKEFKLEFRGFHSFGFSLPNTLDVNSKDEVYFRDIDEKSDTVISVFNLDGKRLRQLVPLATAASQGSKEWVLNTDFAFRLDESDNIILLYTKKGMLVKFDSQGKKVWEHNLYEDYVREEGKKEKFDIVDNSKQYTVTYTLDFINLCLVAEGKILISTVKGGLLYDKDGKPLCNYKVSNRNGFYRHTFVWYKDTLITPEYLYKLKTDFK